MWGALELMVDFVERRTQFTVDFGDIDEPFYLSPESMFGRVLELLKRSEPELVERASCRASLLSETLPRVSSGGTNDYLCEALDGALPGEEEIGQ